jgi:N-dimethylarginine dimethylaminohydrolase
MSIRLLVSPPSRCANPVDINPRTLRKGGYNIPKALREWDRFIEMLPCAGDVTLVEIEPHDEAPDLTFTGNTALIYGNLAVLSSFRHPERRRQQNVFRAALSQAGLATTYLRQTYFEGASNTLFDRVRPLCYTGVGRHKDWNEALELREIVGCRVLQLPLIDKRFFHLDMALCPLGSGHVLAYLPAFAPEAQTRLRRAIEPEFLIEIDIEDALALACNAVEVDDALVLHGASRRLRDQLNHIGYRLFCTALDEFLNLGRGAKKLTLRLDDGPAELKAASLLGAERRSQE